MQENKIVLKTSQVVYFLLVEAPTVDAKEHCQTYLYKEPRRTQNLVLIISPISLKAVLSLYHLEIQFEKFIATAISSNGGKMQTESQTYPAYLCYMHPCYPPSRQLVWPKQNMPSKEGFLAAQLSHEIAASVHKRSSNMPVNNMNQFNTCIMSTPPIFITSVQAKVVLSLNPMDAKSCVTRASVFIRRHRADTQERAGETGKVAHQLLHRCALVDTRLYELCHPFKVIFDHL